VPQIVKSEIRDAAFFSAVLKAERPFRTTWRTELPGCGLTASDTYGAATQAASPLLLNVYTVSVERGWYPTASASQANLVGSGR